MGEEAGEEKGESNMTFEEAVAAIGIHPGNVRKWLDKLRVEYTRQHVPAAAVERILLLKKIKPGPPAVAVKYSQNTKLGAVATTSAPRQTCPAACPFKGAGCYADHDNNRVHWDRLTERAKGLTPLEIAEAEAKLIDALPANRDLRLHVTGDCPDEATTRVVAAACERYMARGVRSASHRGKRLPVRVWAYTHNWRTVPRRAWGRVSVLASCETVSDTVAAKTRGYATALVVRRFREEKQHRVVGEDSISMEWTAHVVPCPAQTRGVKCSDCRLCMDDDRLKSDFLTVGFTLHGGGKRKAEERIALL